jgi:integrase
LLYTQAQSLLEQCEADPETEREADPEFKLVILLGLLAGLRRGEIFALQFSNIDWDKDVIHVRRNLFWRYGKHHELAEDEPTL